MILVLRNFLMHWASGIRFDLTLEFGNDRFGVLDDFTFFSPWRWGDLTRSISGGAAAIRG